MPGRLRSVLEIRLRLPDIGSDTYLTAGDSFSGGTDFTKENSS